MTIGIYVSHLIYLEGFAYTITLAGSPRMVVQRQTYKSLSSPGSLASAFSESTQERMIQPFDSISSTSFSYGPGI
jgi:hypothetical protein